MASGTQTIGSPGREVLTWSVAVSLICALAAAVVDQMQGLISAGGSAALVLAYFVSGQLVERVALRRADGSGMAIVMASYALRVGALGVVLWWALSTPAVTSYLNPTWVAAGGLTAVVVWLAGLVLGHSRARIPIYDTPYQVPEGWDK